MGNDTPQCTPAGPDGCALVVLLPGGYQTGALTQFLRADAARQGCRVHGRGVDTLWVRRVPCAAPPAVAATAPRPVRAGRLGAMAALELGRAVEGVRKLCGASS